MKIATSRISRPGSHLRRACLSGKRTGLSVLLFTALSMIGCDDRSSYDIILEGHVQDTQGAAVQGVDIALHWSDGGSLNVVTDTDGRFRYGYDYWSADWTPSLTVVITPGHPDYSFSPPEYNLDGERSHIGIVFIATPMP